MSDEQEAEKMRSGVVLIASAVVWLSFILCPMAVDMDEQLTTPNVGKCRVLRKKLAAVLEENHCPDYKTSDYFLLTVSHGLIPLLIFLELVCLLNMRSIQQAQTELLSLGRTRDIYGPPSYSQAMGLADTLEDREGR